MSTTKYTIKKVSTKATTTKPMQSYIPEDLLAKNFKHIHLVINPDIYNYLVTLGNIGGFEKIETFIEEVLTQHVKKQVALGNIKI